MSPAATAIERRFAPAAITEFRGETTVAVTAERIADVCRFCQEELGFNYLIDISSVDLLGEEPRFALVYELYAFDRGEHLRLKTAVPESDPVAPTVTGVWAGADWHEREIYDMMGIRFRGHPDLRRILMWDGYPFHPLRKDFPLAGLPSDTPEVAFSAAAPLAGGPFVSAPAAAPVQDREPRARTVSRRSGTEE